MVLATLAGVQSHSALAQHGMPIITTYDDTNYYGSNNFWDIVQDDRGVMYFGNSNYGIQQFDGIHWNVISPPNSTQAYELAKNDRGTIFAGLRSDFGYLKPDSLGRMQFRSFLTQVPDSLQDFDVVRDVVTLRNTAYFCTNEKLFRWRDGELDVWSDLKNAGCMASDSTFYINQYDTGLFELKDDGLEKVTPVLKKKVVQEILQFPESLIFVTKKAGAFVKQAKNIRKAVNFTSLYAQSRNIVDVVLLSDDNIAFGTYNGIYIYTKNGQRLHHLTVNDGLSDNHIRGLHVDQIGRLWAGTDYGISSIEYSNPTRILFDAGQYNARPEQVGYYQQKIYLSTDNGLMKQSNDGWRMLPVDKVVEDFTTVGNILLMGTSEGLFMEKNNKIEKIHNNSVFRITKSSKYKRLVYLYNPDGKLSVLRLMPGGEIHNYTLKEYTPMLYTLVEDRQGDLWLGTGNQGIYREHIKRKDNRLQVVNTTHYTQQDGLPARSFNYSTKIAGAVGFITERGLYRFDQDSQQIVRDSRFRDVYNAPNFRSWPVTEDRFGHVWMDFGSNVYEAISNNDGSYRFVNKPYLRMDSFGDINHILTIDSSKTVFLTGDYLTAVDKEKIGVADRSFNTLIADVTIGSDSLLFGGIVADKDSLNEKIQFTTDPIRFNWSAATYYPQTHTSFRYRLKGLDSEWSNWTNETYRDFTNLPGGTYSFEVQGRNIYKKIGKTASLTFEVLPPWYRTVWAYLGYVMVGVVFIIGVIKWRESKANRRQRKLEDKIDQRTRELRKEKRQLEKANKTIQQQSEQLKRMDEIKNEFFANISHELRTPLTLIRGPIRQMLQQENGIEAEYKQKLNLIDQNAERLEHMVRRILELSRLENGSLDLNWTKIEMPQFLERILSSFESLAHDHGIQLEIECTDQLGALYADQQKLEQVFTNLISNAIKFTDKRGRVILKAEEKASPEPGVQIQLEDTGRGIGSEHLAHIFDRFYNVELKEDYREGLGIGLALTKQLVELHEGNISVESEKGTGTTFTVFLPDKHKPGQAKGHEKEEPYYEQEVQAVADRTIDLTKKEPVKIESATVLVVDDNESMRHYIKGMLEKIFGTIELAEDGELALKMIEETAYDLIIADVMMPNMDGFTLAEQIMNGDRYRDIPFIFVTARAGEKEQLRGLRIGVNDYVIKPFLPEELMIRAKNLVKAYRRRKHWIKVEGSGDELDDRDDELVEKLRTFVVDHIDDSDLTVEQLAPELNYSTRQVYRKLKSLTGYTPAQFIKEVRLQHARQLLEEDSDLRISELAKAVGFNTPSYFSSQFKERFGSSPSKYS